jgi:peptidoglycan-associated lipoprotein
MKLLKLAKLLVVGFALTSIVAGCKGPQHTTPLLGRETIGHPPKDPDPNKNPIGSGNVATDLGTRGTPLTQGSGIATTDRDFSRFTPDRSEFAAQTVYFDLDKAIVKSTEVSKLEMVAARMKSLPGRAVRVEGHCDERGTEEYNRSLGERRALAVREGLVRLGMDPSMIDTVSFGEDHPADPGHNETAWKKNRRGEFILLIPPGR